MVVKDSRASPAATVHVGHPHEVDCATRRAAADGSDTDIAGRGAAAAVAALVAVSEVGGALMWGVG